MKPQVDPFTNPTEWNYAIIGGARTPGVITEIAGADITYKLDDPNAKGTSGSDPTYNGRDVAKPVITIQLYTQRHFLDWYEFVDLMKVKDAVETKTTAPTTASTTKKPQITALDIQHPWFALADISSVIIEKIGQPKRQADRRYTVELAMRSYKKPVPSGGKPGGSTVAKKATYSESNKDTWATVPDPDGVDYRRHDPPDKAGQAVAGEALAQEEDPQVAPPEGS